MVVALGLVACGKNDGAKEGKKVEISYALWDTEQQKIYKEVAKDFEKENPNIKINFELTPWAQYWTKLETAITGGNAPDVFWLNTPYAQEYIESGIVAKLDDVTFDKEKFPERYLEAYSKDGMLYAIPKDFDSHALFYNKQSFDDAGIDYPDETWDWDKLKEVAKELTNKEKDVYGMSTNVTWQGGYYEFIYENKGNPFKDNGTKSGFDTPETIEAMKYYYSFSEEGLAPSVELQAASSGKEMLLAGTVAMAVDGSYMVPQYLGDDRGLANIDVAPIPKGVERACTSNPLAHAVSSNTEHAEEAKKWVEYLSSKEAMIKVGNSGLVLPVYEGSQEGWINAYPDQNLQVFVDALEYAVPLPNKKNNMAAIAIEQEYFNDAWLGKITIEEACTKVTKKANEILSKE